MPCGSGKTLTGITVCSIVRRSVLIFVTSVMAGHQWKKEFIRWTNIDANLVSVFTNDAKKKGGGWNPNAKVVLFLTQGCDLDLPHVLWHGEAGSGVGPHD